MDFLKAEFSPDLRAKRYDLIVYEGKQKLPVLPGRYSGIPFSVLSLETRKKEKLTIDLYLTQKPLMQRVALFVRGKQILVNIAELPEFRPGGPWKSGRVAGEISADFLKPTTGRTAIEHGDEWKRFVETLRSVEGQLDTQLEKIAEEQRAREATRIFKEINQVLSNVLPNLKWSQLRSRPLEMARLMCSRRGTPPLGQVAETARQVRVARERLPYLPDDRVS